MNESVKTSTTDATPGTLPDQGTEQPDLKTGPVRPLLAYLTLAIGVLALSGSAIFVRWAQAPGPVTNFYRMLLAVILLAVPFYRRYRQQSFPVPVRRRGAALALLGGAALGGDLAFWSTGVVMSGATNPTLLANMAPLWVGLGTVLFFRERFQIRFWFGLVLAILGSFLVLGLDTLRSAELGLGSAFGLIASLFYAGYFLLTQRGRQYLDALSYFWIASASSALTLLTVNLLFQHSLTGYAPQTYAKFAALGVFTQVIGFLAISYALGFLPAAVVSPTLIGQPLMTALLAWLLLDERLSLWHLFGGGAVLVGVYLVHRFQQRL